MSEKAPITHAMQFDDSGTLDPAVMAAPFLAPFGHPVLSAIGEYNPAYEASSDESEPQRDLRSNDRRNEARRSSSTDADGAEFLSVSRPPRYQRSVSDDFFQDLSNKTYILMRSLSSENGNAGVEEASLDIELAEAMMSGGTSGNARGDVAVERRVNPHKRYRPSWVSDNRISFNSEASGSRDSVPPESARSSTFSTATTVSDENRKSRVTITPHLDRYFRNRPTAIVADNPAVGDRDTLVDNEAPADSGPSQTPLGNSQVGGSHALVDGWMEFYLKVTKTIINHPLMFVLCIPLVCWSFYCIYRGYFYMQHCPLVDTIPILLVFLGITGAVTTLCRMFHMVLHKSLGYQSTLKNILPCLQCVMFLGYFFIYIFGVASFLVLDIRSLQDKCAQQYYTFTFWNLWVQLPVVAVIVLLYGPSAIRSKWC